MVDPARGLDVGQPTVDPETGAESGPPPPPTVSPVAGRVVPSLVEVVLCSGFPTQLVLSALLAAAGFDALAPTGEPSFVYIVSLTLLDVLVVLCLIATFLHARKESIRELVLGARPPEREAALGLLLIAPIVVAAVGGILIIEWLAPGLRNVPDNPFGAMLGTPGRALIFALVVVLAGGLREELQRAFILRRFDQHLGGGWVGLVVFSIAFGLGHAIQGWDTVIVTGALGAFWGALYLTRGSAVAAMVSHAGFNLTQIALALVGGRT